MTDSTSESSSARAATYAYLADRLFPSITRTQHAVDGWRQSEGPETDFYKDCAPHILLLRRDLQLLFAGVDTNLFVPPSSFQTHDLHPANDRDSEPSHEELDFHQFLEWISYSWRESPPNILEIIAYEELSEPPLREGMAFLGTPFGPRTQPATRSIDESDQDAVSAAIAVSSWHCVDFDLLEFVARATLRDTEVWRQDLAVAQSAFVERFDPCWCDRRQSIYVTPVTDPEQAQMPDPDRLLDRCRWLFDGSLRMLDALADTEAMLADTDPVGFERESDSQVPSVYRSLGAVGGEQVFGVRAVAPLDTQYFFDRVVEALSIVWRTTEILLPPSQVSSLFSSLGSWDQPEVRQLLTLSNAPFAEIRRSRGSSEPPPGPSASH